MERVKAATLSAVISTFEFAMFLCIPGVFMGAAALFLLKNQQQIITFVLR